MDVYVYVETAPASALRVAQGIADLEVREVVVVTGPWDVIAAVEGVDPTELGSTILDGIQRIEGVVRTNTQIVVDPPEQAVWPWPKPFRRRQLEAEVIGLVHITIEAGSSPAVIKGLEEAGVVDGLALLAGDWDLLAEITAPTWDEVARAVLEQIQPIKGILRTSTNVAVTPKLKYAAAGE